VAVAHRVYAEALLAAVDEKDRLDSVRGDFDEFAAALAGSEELRRFLQNPQIEAGTKRGALEDLLGGADELFLNFVRLLADKDRIGDVRDIHHEWTRLLARRERVLELELTTAVELSDKEADRVVKQIEEAASSPSGPSTRTSSAASSSRRDRCASMPACADVSSSCARN
jgi:F-type H+-transporting ATPase subunit delta